MLQLGAALAGSEPNAKTQHSIHSSFERLSFCILADNWTDSRQWFIARNGWNVCLALMIVPWHLYSSGQVDFLDENLTVQGDYIRVLPPWHRTSAPKGTGLPSSVVRMSRAPCTLEAEISRTLRSGHRDYLLSPPG